MEHFLLDYLPVPKSYLLVSKTILTTVTKRKMQAYNLKKIVEKCENDLK
jgi:hypothetical protein